MKLSKELLKKLKKICVMNEQELKRAQINYFKNELKSMKFFLTQIEIYKQKFEEAENKLQNVKSSSNSDSEKVTVYTTFDERFNYWLTKKQDALFEYNKYRSRVDDIMTILDEMEQIERKLIVDIYVKNCSFDLVCINNGVTRNELQYFIDHTIDFYLGGMRRKQII